MMKQLLLVYYVVVALIAPAEQSALPIATPEEQAAMADRLYDDLLAYHAERVKAPYRHETEEDRAVRIRWIADGVPAACAAEPFDAKLGWTFAKCVALATTAAKWESGLVVEVHSGAQKGPSGELCLFQLHRLVAAVPDPHYRVTPEERLATVGLTQDATYRCALAGVRTLAWHIHRCRLRGDDFVAPARIFSEYHLPSQRCTEILTRMNSIRASSYRALLPKLEAH